jgi:hypothetical protein
MSRRSITTILLFIVLLPLLSRLRVPAQLAAAPAPDPRFGVVEAHQAPAHANALGAGWTRMRFEWNQIQPESPDQWNAPFSDQVLNNELASGREVVGLLITTPGWATDADRGAGVPWGLYQDKDDPGNLWAGFVRRVVGEYAGRIDRWTIWNEPDIPPSSPDATWGGNVEDFVRLLQVAHEVARETNPNARIHMAAITHHHDQHWFGRFLNALVAQPGAAENGYYFDVATLHLYHEPEKIHDITAHYLTMMRGHGIQSPLWIAETNAYLSRVTPEQQAYFLPQAFSLGIAAGAERIAVYKMADVPSDAAADPEPFGLVRMDGSRRPAFTAYRVATSYLAGFRSARWERRDDVAVVTVDRGPRTTTVLWSRTPAAQTAMVPARAVRALLVDPWGSTRRVYPERGYYYVELPGATCVQGCAVGGAPYMLVEEAPMTARTAPTPRSPTPTPTPTPSPRAAPHDDATPEGTSTVQPSPTAAVTRTPSPTPTRTLSPTSTSTISTSTASPTSSPTRTATWTPTLVAPTETRPPNETDTPSPTLPHRAEPTDEPTTALAEPVAAPGPRGRSWILIGALLIGLAGVALVARSRRS